MGFLKILLLKYLGILKGREETKREKPQGIPDGFKVGSAEGHLINADRSKQPFQSVDVCSSHACYVPPKPVDFLPPRLHTLLAKSEEQHLVTSSNPVMVGVSER